MKKTLLSLLGVLMAFPALARDITFTHEGQTLTYMVISEEEKTVETKEGNSVDGELVIPEKIEADGVTYSVTSIGDDAFYRCYNLTSVEIPNSVTSIGERAFYGSGLTSVIIPPSVTSIGERAFYECDNLEKGAYPFPTINNPFSYGIGAAYNPEGAVIENGCIWSSDKTEIYFASISLKGEFILPPSVISIGVRAFYRCYNLTSVIIPPSVNSIREYAFYGCSGLTSVIIPPSVSTIGYYAFYECDNLEKGAYPNCIYNPFSYSKGVAYNPEGAVIENGCIWNSDKTEICFASISLKGEFILPNSVTSIGERAFYRCYNLTSVIIPPSVTSIGERAFYGCSGLTSVIIHPSVTSIGNLAFDECDNLKKGAYPNTIKNPFSSGKGVAYNPEGAVIENGCIWNSDKTEICFASTSLEGEFIIPNSVTSIGEWAFYGCKLTEVNCLAQFPPSMNDNTFSGLYDTAILSVPTGFFNNYLVTNWSLFKNIKSNEPGAEMSKLYSDGVYEYRLNPNDMTAIIIGAKGITDLQIPERFTDETDPDNLVRYYVKGIGYKAFENKNITNVAFNSRCQIEMIGDYSFANNRNLSEINFPATVSILGNNAFQSCTSLKAIEIPDLVSEIGNSCFDGCSSLSEVKMAEGLKRIGDNAFQNCSGLTSVSIPASVETIASYAFYKTSNLNDIELNEGLKELGEGAFRQAGTYVATAQPIFIPSSVTTIGNDAFLNSKLSKVKINDLAAWCKIDFANESANPLSVCGKLVIADKELTNVDIPEEIEEVKPYTFLNLNLNSLFIPDSVKAISENCVVKTQIKSLTVGTGIEEIQQSNFLNCKINYLVLTDTEKPLSLPKSSEWVKNITDLYMGRPITLK